MASTLSSRARAAAVVGATALLVTGVAGPASAMTGNGVGTTYDDGEERGTTMSAVQIVLVFVVLPLAIAGLVWLLVKAPGWTRSGRATDAWTGEPLDVGAADAPAVEAGAGVEPAELPAAEGTGGTSARW